MAESIKLSKFDMRRIPSNAVVVVIGKRGTGKTTLTADIMYNIRNRFDAGICFSATEESNSFWGHHVPDTLIHSEFDENTFKNFINEQRRINGKLSKPINSFAIMEDCMYSKILRTNKDIRGTFFNGRHWNIFLVVTMQYVLDLPPELRSNIDFVFILRNNMVNDREKLYKHFCGFVPNFSTFQKIMNKCTQGYECLVVDNTARSNDISDCLFWYSGEGHGDFKIGKRAVWEYHYKLRKLKEKSDEEDEDYFKDLAGRGVVSKNAKISKLAS
tara:strand:+ start:685 stop:1500 length:816 start_codon:yes stop_codon:yes gene_type:complete